MSLNSRGFASRASPLPKLAFKQYLIRSANTYVGCFCLYLWLYIKSSCDTEIKFIAFNNICLKKIFLKGFIQADKVKYLLISLLYRVLMCFYLLYSTNVEISSGEQATTACVAQVIASLLHFLLFCSCWRNQSKDEALDPEVS